MALPWLESLPAFADTTQPAVPRSGSRVLFMGNGVNEDHWDANGNGADMKLSKTLRAARAVEAQDQRDSRPLPEARHRAGHSPRADGQPALRRA